MFKAAITDGLSKLANTFGSTLAYLSFDSDFSDSRTRKHSQYKNLSGLEIVGNGVKRAGQGFFSGLTGNLVECVNN